MIMCDVNEFVCEIIAHSHYFIIKLSSMNVSMYLCINVVMHANMQM